MNGYPNDLITLIVILRNVLKSFGSADPHMEIMVDSATLEGLKEYLMTHYPSLFKECFLIDDNTVIIYNVRIKRTPDLL